MAKTQYPRKQDGTCIVCEDIRVEKSNKYFLIGVYPGGGINFNHPISVDKPGSQRLAVCFWFNRCAGKFDIHVKVYTPDGSLYGESKIGEKIGEKDKALMFNIQPALFQFTQTGAYRIEVSLNDRKYEFPLSISASE